MTIAKATNSLTVKANAQTVKKSKKVTVKGSKAFSVSKEKGKVTYKAGTKTVTLKITAK